MVYVKYTLSCVYVEDNVDFCGFPDGTPARIIENCGAELAIANAAEYDYNIDESEYDTYEEYAEAMNDYYSTASFNYEYITKEEFEKNA